MLEYIWNNKSWYNKNYENALETVITILWLFGRNNIVFRNHKCTPVHVLEMERKVFHDTILYNKDINLNAPANIASSSTINAGKDCNIKH